jgi:NADH-quinone oxidoreductase subunit C
MSGEQQFLDRVALLLGETVGNDAVELAQINQLGSGIPTITVRSDQWAKAAETLKLHPETAFNYLRNVSGVDQETHLEVAYHLINLTSKHELCVKVKTNREEASIPSVTLLWSTANWNEREIFDLLGIDFPGHPDLRRIMMPDDWVGYPLRKDYVSIDPEV